MAADGKQKSESKEPKEKKEKKAKAKADDAQGDAPAAAPKPPPPPRQPSDPRVKLMKQLRSKLLPRGELRDRYKNILGRWDASGDHSGVTDVELKSLIADRKSSRLK